MSYCAAGVNVKLSEYNIVTQLSTAGVFVVVTDGPGAIHILRSNHGSLVLVRALSFGKKDCCVYATTVVKVRGWK